METDTQRGLTHLQRLCPGLEKHRARVDLCAAKEVMSWAIYVVIVSD